LDVDVQRIEDADKQGQLAQELVDASVAALDGLGPRADPLRELARYVVTRKT